MSNLPSEPEFEQAYKGMYRYRILWSYSAQTDNTGDIDTELASTLENSTLFQKQPEYRKALQVASIPERVIQFRVVWEDDKGEVQISLLRYCRIRANGLLFFTKIVASQPWVSSAVQLGLGSVQGWSTLPPNRYVFVKEQIKPQKES